MSQGATGHLTFPAQDSPAGITPAPKQHLPGACPGPAARLTGSGLESQGPGYRPGGEYPLCLGDCSSQGMPHAPDTCSTVPSL